MALPFVPDNLTLTANGTTVVLLTGSAGGLPGGYVPFVGAATNLKEASASLSMWAIGVLGLVCVVGIL